MLVSHESPISMLEESREYNSYDYALVHLFETHPEYYSFFKQSLLQGREVLLDNSIFELGHAFDSIKFAKYVEELKPTYYIVPDVLEDSQATMASFHKFKLQYPDLPGLTIGVVQGKTYQQLVKCYKYMSVHADYIAISFDYSWYNTIGHYEPLERPSTIMDAEDSAVFEKLLDKDRHRTSLELLASGRRKFINMLIDDGIWNHNKPHHLLGNSLPQEMKHYKNIKSIRSVDTSNPVVAGIKGIRYIKDYGMVQKPKTLLADLIDYDVSNDQKEDIFHNTQQFKTFCNE
jgi:hypothetical protein